MSSYRGQPVNWRRGLVGWVFSPEVPGRYGLVIGATDTAVCIVVEGDPRIRPDMNIEADASLHIWVTRGAIHAPQDEYRNVYAGYSSFQSAKTVERENTVTFQSAPPWNRGPRGY